MTSASFLMAFPLWFMMDQRESRHNVPEFPMLHGNRMEHGSATEPVNLLLMRDERRLQQQRER
jgi:hypothetical protein